MVVSQAERSVHLRVAAEALELLRSNGSPEASRAQLFWHSVRNDEEPHPRVVRAVHQALVEAVAAEARNPRSTLKKISGVFSRRKEPATLPLDELLREFERSFQPH